jgi:hypothetical protein
MAAVLALFDDHLTGNSCVVWRTILRLRDRELAAGHVRANWLADAWDRNACGVIQSPVAARINSAPFDPWAHTISEAAVAS